MTDMAVFTYREIMQLVLRYSGRENRRFILSLPYWVGMLQGWLLEKLPENLFTVTRDQVRLWTAYFRAIPMIFVYIRMRVIIRDDRRAHPSIPVPSLC